MDYIRNCQKQPDTKHLCSPLLVVNQNCSGGVRIHSTRGNGGRKHKPRERDPMFLRVPLESPDTATAMFKQQHYTSMKTLFIYVLNGRANVRTKSQCPMNFKSCLWFVAGVGGNGVWVSRAAQLSPPGRVTGAELSACNETSQGFSAPFIPGEDPSHIGKNRGGDSSMACNFFLFEICSKGDKKNLYGRRVQIPCSK